MYPKRHRSHRLFRFIEPIGVHSQRSADGLTTLEWLLIVAAVAGLAALAVVLVQNVVDETAEEISGNSARGTAARVAADRISSDALDDAEALWTDKTKALASGNSKYPDATTRLTRINSDAASKCDRLEITYSDISLAADWTGGGFMATAKSANNTDLRSKLASQGSCKLTIP